MLDLLAKLAKLGRRALIVFVILQGITAVVIGRSYKQRKKRNRQGKYPTIELAPVAIEEGEAQLYMEGVSLFADMQEAIAGARDTIFFETFIWKDDEIGQAFRDLFIKKAREGVEVHLMYDLVSNGLLGGSRLTFPDDIPTLHVQRYVPFTRWFHFLLPWRYSSTHRKALVIDGKLGYVGGYNIGEEYRDWRDTHMRIPEGGAQRLAYAFVDLWNQYRDDDLPELQYPEQEWSNVIDVYRNDPLRKSYRIRSVYLRAIERAQKRVLITNAYFVPDPTFRRALIQAAKRGVSVEVVLPWRSNHAVVDYVARHWFEEYLEAGVRLYGYEGAMIHTKTMTIDGMWSTVGTANLDRLSLGFNHEINMEIFDERVAAQMENVFACDLEASREIDLGRWRARPFRMRFGERALAPLWPIV